MSSRTEGERERIGQVIREWFQSDESLTATFEELADAILAALREVEGTRVEGWVDQPGDHECWIACLASLTGLPLGDFPQPPSERCDSTEVEYHNAVNGFLRRNGWALVNLYERVPAGYAIASGPSPRGGGLWHSVVYRNGLLAHDPHPSRAGLTDGVCEYEIVVPLILHDTEKGRDDRRSGEDRRKRTIAFVVGPLRPARRTRRDRRQGPHSTEGGDDDRARHGASASAHGADVATEGSVEGEDVAENRVASSVTSCTRSADPSSSAGDESCKSCGSRVKKMGGSGAQCGSCGTPLDTIGLMEIRQLRRLRTRPEVGEALGWVVLRDRDGYISHPEESIYDSYEGAERVAEHFRQVGRQTDTYTVEPVGAPASEAMGPTPERLREWAEWFDNPNESAVISILLGGPFRYTPVYLLRRIAEAMEADDGE